MATYSVQFGIERVQNIEIERNQSSLCSVAIEEEKDISYIFVYECVCTHIQLHTYIMYSIYVYWFTHGHCGVMTHMENVLFSGLGSTALIMLVAIIRTVLFTGVSELRELRMYSTVYFQ